MVSLIFSSTSFARDRRDPFVVTIEGFTKDLTKIKLSAEYKAAKSTSYCRGISMAAPAGEWSCEVVGTGVSRCERSYQCKLVTRDNNVSTETARIVAELKKGPKLASKYKVEFSDKPKNKLNKSLVSRITNPNDLGDPSGLKLSPQEIEALRQNRIDKEKLRYVQEQVRNDNKLAENEAELARRRSGQSAAQKFVPIKETSGKLKKQKPKTEQEELEDLYSEEFMADKKTEPTDWKLEKTRTTDGDTLYYKLGEKKVSKEKVVPPLKLMSFTGAMLQSSDDEGNSLATFELAWTPEYSFKNKWGVRGLLGAHFFKTTNIVNANDEGESFLVFDIAALATYEMGRMYAEAGVGIQKWNDQVGESFTALHLGLGYRFKNYQLLLVDRIFISYTRVSTLTSNTDLRFGLGISF